MPGFRRIAALFIPLLLVAQERDISPQQHFDTAQQLRKTAASRAEALSEYRKALDLWSAAGDVKAQAETLVRMGQVADQLGDRAAAAAYFERALPLARDRANPRGEAEALYGLGRISLASGDASKAIGLYRQALGLRRQTGDSFEEALILHNLGAAYWTIAENQKALEAYQQALSLRRASGDRIGVAITLYGIAIVHYSWGDAQKALATYSDALKLWRDLKDPRGEANSLNSIGLVYGSLEENEKALERYRQALTIFRKTADKSGEAYTLNNVGLAYSGLHDTRRALEFLNRALIMLTELKDQRGTAYTLHNIGEVKTMLHDYDAAKADFGKSLTIKRELHDRYGEAYTLDKLAEVRLATGDAAGALEMFHGALELHRFAGDRAGEASALAGIARVHLARGQLQEARASMESALQGIESLRSRLASHDLRSSYFSGKQDYYSFYIDLLMQMGETGAALEASERSRARVFLDSITETQARIREGIDPALAARESAVLSELNAQRQRLQRLTSNPGQEAESRTANQRLQESYQRYDEVKTAIRQASPRYSALTQPEPVRVDRLQRELLNPQTALLEYSLGTEKSHAWLVTEHELQSAVLPGRDAINAIVQRYFHAVTARNDPPREETIEEQAGRLKRSDADALRAGRELRRILIEPFAASLTPRLLIVADGPLAYLPFAALPGAGGALVAKHEIVSLPSASSLLSLRADSRAKDNPAGVAIVADPVFDARDPRVQTLARGPEVSTLDFAERAPLYPRLRFSRFEADEIAKLVPASQTMKIMDFAANRAAIKNGAFDQYRILHFATHTVIDNEHPELSGIVLSLVDDKGRPRDGFLPLYDIYNLKLKSRLVVLSACRTAIGKQIRGEGLMGLSRGFLYSGVSSVVASLWSVQDKATAELMRRFYSGMLQRHLTPSAALRAAQNSFANDANWSSPYYWAAFTLQGDWQ